MTQGNSLGEVFGKITPKSFTFYTAQDVVEGKIVFVFHEFYKQIRCKITRVQKGNPNNIAHCAVIGFTDKNGQLQLPKIPIEPGTKVYENN
ncbi:MAG: hypothetical protein ACLFNM_01915 [Candidatus Woesearchaeota archaeon]